MFNKQYKLKKNTATLIKKNFLLFMQYLKRLIKLNII